MSMTSIGDLSRSLVLRTRSTHLKQTMATLTDELSTGRISDVSARLGGDYSYLSDIERNLIRLDGHRLAATEAGQFAAAAQQSTGRLHDLATDLGATLMSVSLSSTAMSRDHVGQQAAAALDTVISTLNGSISGRSLFAGTATDRAPLASGTKLLDELKTVLAAATSADAVAQMARDWFEAPDGFRALIYQGSDVALAPVEIGPGERIAMPLRADDAVFCDLLRDLAVAALAGDGDLGLDAGGQAMLLRQSGEGMLAAQVRLTGLGADLGFAEARIEEASARNASARTGLEYARKTLLEADPYETATRLQDVQFQLESLYSVTVRLSRLSLLEFMR